MERSSRTASFGLACGPLPGKGAVSEVAPMWTGEVIVGGRLITGQKPQSAAGVGAAIRMRS